MAIRLGRSMLILLMILPSCASKKEIRHAPYDPSQKIPYREVGRASWYGEEYHGRKTANGEVYDMHAMTAAHPTLPFHVRVQVTNLENGKKVQLRINDRGPFVPGRIIDVSKRGAMALGFLIQGTARVEVETIGFAGGTLPSLEGTYSIQVGAFADKGNADRLHGELFPKHPSVRIVLFETHTQKIYRVRLGKFRSESEARRYLENLRPDPLLGIVGRED